MQKLLKLSKARFLYFKNEFYRQVAANPLSTQLHFESVSDANTPFDEFKKDAQLDKKTIKIPCLFDLEATSTKRELFGIAEDIDCVLFISPIHLFKAIGKEKFPNKYSVTATFKEEEYILGPVRYLEEMYGSCVSIRLDLKTAQKIG